MSLRNQLRTMVEAMPAGSSVSLPVDFLRGLLDEISRAGDQPDRLLTLEDVAGEVGRAVSTVRTWCNTGALEGAFRLNGRDWRIPEDALRRYLEAQANPEPPPVATEDVDLGAWRRIRQKRKDAA